MVLSRGKIETLRVLMLTCSVWTCDDRTRSLRFWRRKKMVSSGEGKVATHQYAII